MEKRFGKYAIRNLPSIIIGLYAAGYLLLMTAPNVLIHLTLDPPSILRGEIWRLITWVIVPGGRLSVWTIIMLWFYYSVARALERTWGAFRFNFYYFSGMLFSIIGAFIIYAFVPSAFVPTKSYFLFSTYYINMSMLLAFAMSYPDATVMLYFVIPVKMKWVGVLDAVLIAYSFFGTSVPGKIEILTAMLNFLIFFFTTRPVSGSFKQAKRRTEFRKAYQFGGSSKTSPKRPQAGKGTFKDPNGKISIHRCAQCGRTEKDSDQLEFRYCSKCNGAYEYCQDHLFTHVHKQ